eukprot:CAMPEP_0205913936 /NCGR_PEP_ID=MMETSP1325-20131115/6894_1 /ASSEMBLY_ACC=CAM_ASM_000708 /TAXON_ID=236786 /ORGANISM="Florenciella sp., Strain RCC1007" /LENGTH=138 /DNA_ID=CAMNT_0053280903 /DNA_START=158 /DNA_END=575 /DNA_ORIENTATION=-
MVHASHIAARSTRTALTNGGLDEEAETKTAPCGKCHHEHTTEAPACSVLGGYVSLDRRLGAALIVSVFELDHSATTVSAVLIFTVVTSVGQVRYHSGSQHCSHYSAEYEHTKHDGPSLYCVSRFFDSERRRRVLIGDR